MPVHDHDTHWATQITSKEPYGCGNAKRRNWYLGQDGWNPDGTRRMIYIPDRGSEKCRYDMRAADSRCGECELPSDTEYLESFK